MNVEEAYEVAKALELLFQAQRLRDVGDPESMAIEAEARRVLRALLELSAAERELS